MNEQLIVKNFGPIKDATVDFKRVTVFIGPTGGGKSTLAKLAAIMRDENQHKAYSDTALKSGSAYKNFSIKNHFSAGSFINFKSSNALIEFKEGKHDTTLFSHADTLEEKISEAENLISLLDDLRNKFQESREPSIANKLSKSYEDAYQKARLLIVESADEFAIKVAPSKSSYLPAERVFVPALEYSWAGLMRDDIGLPKILLDFANNFSLARKEILELEITFLNVKYIHIDGRDFIRIPDREEPVMLFEAASGIQSVTPLLVLLEHLSRNTEQAQSFIIEEPELNLYPTAQQGLLNWLVEKCTQGENDLTITTHSPYILSSCNLLLEAYKVAQLRPDLEEKIAAIVPKACWLNPDEFAAYYVADGTVKPITDERTHLIGGNELDAVSGDISDSFRKLLRLQKQKQRAA